MTNLEIGIEKYLAGKTHQALDSFLKVLEKEPNHQEATYYIGCIHQKREEYNEAKLFFTKSNTRKARYQHANCQLATDATIEALHTFNELIKINDNDDIAHLVFYKLGLYNDEGIAPIMKNEAKAIEYYQKSNTGKAKYNLALIYENQSKTKEALDAYKEAGKLGIGDAYYNLGIHYDKVKDADSAKKYYTLGANECKHIECAYALAVQLEEEGDTEKAMTYYEQAAKAGYSDAQFNLAVNAEEKEDYETAKKYLELAAAQGHAEATFNIGTSYENGDLGLDQNYNKAFIYYSRAADLGSADALLNLGILYHNGHGVDKDIQQALDCYKKAHEKGHPDALLRIGLAMYGSIENMKKQAMKSK